MMRNWYAGEPKMSRGYAALQVVYLLSVGVLGCAATLGVCGYFIYRMTRG